MKKIRTRKRKASSFNKQTANESLQMGLRVAVSYGPFCTLSHVLSIDKELKETWMVSDRLARSKKSGPGRPEVVNEKFDEDLNKK